MVNLEAHVKNVQKFGVPVIVALNRFASDTEEEIHTVLDASKDWGPRRAERRLGQGRRRGRGGGEGNPVAPREKKGKFKPLYDVALPIKEDRTIAREIYGADGVDYTATAEKNIAQCEAMGLGATPVCMAKTQYSFSDDATKLGRPTGFRLTIRDVTPSAGAGFVVALAGEIMTMPGLSKTPSAEAIRVHSDGTIEGLF